MTMMCFTSISKYLKCIRLEIQEVELEIYVRNQKAVVDFFEKFPLVSF